MRDRHEHDLGLAHDLTVLSRRRVFHLAGIAGASTLVAACTGGTSQQATGTTSTTADAAACATAAPAETAGPYPGDGSNGPNVLIESGIVRSDIRSSFGSYSGVAEGVPATIELTLQDITKDCAAGAGMAVYIWQCDRAGNYSLYNQDAVDQNYLRGVQVADPQGRVSFTSIFPACYARRWPHIHFEVFDSSKPPSPAKRPVDIPDRPARAGVHHRVRIRLRICHQRSEHIAGDAELRQRVRRRLGRRTRQRHRRSGHRHDRLADHWRRREVDERTADRAPAWSAAEVSYVCPGAVIIC